MLRFLLIFIAGASSFAFIYLPNQSTELYQVASFNDSTSVKVEMGRRLFFDPILSRDSTISCSSCHLPELAFTDGKKTSVGIFDRTVSRNSPTLTNISNRPYFLLDGVNPSLEAQVLVPIQEHNEFDFHILLITDRLNKDSSYRALSEKAFGTEVTPKAITSSIAAFERTLISNHSPYDQYMHGNKKALTRSQKRGRQLFFDKLYCGKCHNGSDLTNDLLTNNGLYENYADSGRMRLTLKESDRAIFKVPTLRNIALTSPYMHDGSIATLEDVIQHYQAGGKNHTNQSEFIVPFKLSKRETNDLFNFLHSLTDSTFIRRFSNHEVI